MTFDPICKYNFIFYILINDWKYKLHLSTEFLAGNEPLESVFELPKGWALKSNQKYGQKGDGRFLLAGEADGTRRYIAETMLEELNVMAEEEGQFDKSEVPKLQTIRGWITSYAAEKCKKNLGRSWYSHWNE